MKKKKSVYIPWGWTKEEYVKWCKEWDYWRVIVGEATKGKTIKLVPKEGEE